MQLLKIDLKKHRDAKDPLARPHLSQLHLVTAQLGKYVRFARDDTRFLAILVIIDIIIIIIVITVCFCYIYVIAGKRKMLVVQGREYMISTAVSRTRDMVIMHGFESQ
jgi:hypothetical protein|uniref:Uncharacterized protein n=1 Tax=Sipha flava TaxID=143950 RepID=A0A2S2Q5Q6_9HEMI